MALLLPQPLPLPLALRERLVDSLGLSLGLAPEEREAEGQALAAPTEALPARVPPGLADQLTLPPALPLPTAVTAALALLVLVGRALAVGSPGLPLGLGLPCPLPLGVKLMREAWPVILAVMVRVSNALSVGWLEREGQGEALGEPVGVLPALRL